MFTNLGAGCVSVLAEFDSQRFMLRGHLPVGPGLQGTVACGPGCMKQQHKREVLFRVFKFKTP